MKMLRVSIRALLALALISLPSLPSYATSDNTQRGKIVGGAPHQAPPWFKQSFLEIQDDVEEAAAEGKQVILFFQLAACPYCDRMLTEGFEAEPLSSYIQANFDAIAINIKGDREIAFNSEITVSEKELSEMLKVRGTPAILFLDENNKTVLRVNGYYAPQRFQKIVEFVATRSYQNMSLAEYLQAKLERNVYQLKANPLFRDVKDLSIVAGPLMVIFEDGSCYDCEEFHQRILGREDVQKEIKPFTIVRLDADSDAPIKDVDGTQTTAREMAKKYDMVYRPGVLAFDAGKLIRRSDSLLYHFHFKEGMRYIAGGYYKNQNYRSYSSKRREDLLAAGIEIDLGR